MPKRSTISPRNPDWRPPLFLDATNSAPLLAEILRAAEWQVELHRDHFRQRGNIPDHEWIPVAAKMGCAIISCDKSMRGWLAEAGLVRPVIEKHRAKIFFVRSGMQLEDYAYVIGTARRGICRTFRHHTRTFMCARIHAKGNRLGEIQLLACGEGTRTEKKMGKDSA